ncbi:hypothetical protein DERP_013028 [Dermatophagoides pteronyssinus]|uniref:Uncharacterized protein n=1 Tax=Dermatophagoides pteronyssinus TaxID=6956 RepID=A0ABQ8JQ12_DERPT|nr:hypothetical protein DERP_013028 [Dermatophagoides pteronyssinus]
MILPHLHNPVVVDQFFYYMLDHIPVLVVVVVAVSAGFFTGDTQQNAINNTNVIKILSKAILSEIVHNSNATINLPASIGDIAGLAIIGAFHLPLYLGLSINGADHLPQPANDEHFGFGINGASQSPSIS